MLLGLYEQKKMAQLVLLDLETAEVEECGEIDVLKNALVTLHLPQGIEYAEDAIILPFTATSRGHEYVQQGRRLPFHTSLEDQLVIITIAAFLEDLPPTAALIARSDIEYLYRRRGEVAAYRWSEWSDRIAILDVASTLEITLYGMKYISGWQHSGSYVLYDFCKARTRRVGALRQQRQQQQQQQQRQQLKFGCDSLAGVEYAWRQLDYMMGLSEDPVSGDAFSDVVVSDDTGGGGGDGGESRYPDRLVQFDPPHDPDSIAWEEVRDVYGQCTLPCFVTELNGLDLGGVTDIGMDETSIALVKVFFFFSLILSF